MTTLPPRRGDRSALKQALRDSKGEALEMLPPEPGAGDESRTRDLNLGKVALYQLSYSRIYYLEF